MDQNASKVKTALAVGLGFAMALCSGCTTTRTLSVSPANRTAATSEQGVPCLQSVKKNAVAVWLLTPEYQTDLREFDPPAFRVLVRNGGDKAFDFSPVNVIASSGGNSVHVFSSGEYCQAIDRYEDALLQAAHERTALQKAQAVSAEELLGSVSSRDPMRLGVGGDFSGHQVSDFQAGIDQAATDQWNAINLKRKNLLDEAQLMLVPHTVAPGLMAGGIVKLDPAQISRGQPLKLVVTVGGETHEFVFEVGG